MPKNQLVRKYEVSYHIKGQGVVFVGKIKELPECAA